MCRRQCQPTLRKFAFLHARRFLQKQREGREQLLKNRATRIFLPSVEIGCMQRVHIDRQARRIEAHWNESAAIGANARLAPHPARFDACRRPYDDDDFGRIDLAADQRIAFRSGRDRGIPPDAPALSFELNDERHNARFVRPRI